MLVNSIDIKKFKARLMNRSISNSEFEMFNHWQGANPIYFENGNSKFKTLSITLDILCSDQNELEIMKSNLIVQFKNATIKFDDIDYFYKGFINGKPSYKYIMRGNEIVDIEMLVIAEKEYITETIDRITSKTINVSGNTETPAIVEITPSIGLIDLILTGVSDDPITIKNLVADKKIIIDGESCKVTVDGINKFQDTEMWGFPKLLPGSRTITVDKDSVDITIKYKPRFI